MYLTKSGGAGAGDTELRVEIERAEEGLVWVFRVMRPVQEVSRNWVVDSEIHVPETRTACLEPNAIRILY